MHLLFQLPSAPTVYRSVRLPPPEALAYVSNAALAVPLASDWVEIYQYLLTRVRKERAEAKALERAKAPEQLKLSL
jgi:hypothetical protein